jgi:hypothetical protein
MGVFVHKEKIYMETKPQMETALKPPFCQRVKELYVDEAWEKTCKAEMKELSCQLPQSQVTQIKEYGETVEKGCLESENVK